MKYRLVVVAVWQTQRGAFLQRWQGEAKTDTIELADNFTDEEVNVAVEKVVNAGDCYRDLVSFSFSIVPL